jgi:hypoxanthine phosphoribosyltransferase
MNELKGNASVPVLLSQDVIQQRVHALAKEIRTYYLKSEHPLTVVGVLHGAFVFMADLVRTLDLPIQCDFLSMYSYEGSETTGEIRVGMDVRDSVSGRDVLVVEDIVDTGLTVNFLMEHLARRGAASVRLCTLLSKPARRRIEVPVDYVGFEIEDRFVVGYGMDYNGRYRNLPFIGIVQDHQGK